MMFRQHSMGYIAKANPTLTSGNGDRRDELHLAAPTSCYDPPRLCVGDGARVRASVSLVNI